jgi:hypothetical protein
MPHHPVTLGLRIPGVVKHHRLRIVDDELARHAAKMLERVLVSLEHGTQALVRKRFGEHAPRVA